MSTPPADPTPSPSSGPLWLLDFDGVVNATLSKAAKRPDPSVWKDWARTDIFAPSDGFAYPVWYSPTVVKFIADAHAAGVDVRWLSTWQANTTAFPLDIPGMPALPWVPEPPISRDLDDDPKNTTFESWWKFRAARVLAADRPLIWTDDDLDEWSREYREARAWTRSRPKTHVEVPTSALGLTPKRLRKIAEFLDRCGISLPS